LSHAPGHEAVLLAVDFRRPPALRETLDASGNSSVPPILTIGRLVGFGAVMAAMPAFAMVRDAVPSIQGGRSFRRPSS
jgi:hypothetical protein